jgi:hypothetical protein
MTTLYSLEAWKAGYSALLDLIIVTEDPPPEPPEEAPPSVMRIFDADDVMLAEVTIDTLTSYVDIETADLILEIDEQEVACPAGGLADHARILNGLEEPIIEMPCLQGTEAVPGYCVMNTLTVIQGSPLDVLSIVIPAGAVLAVEE